MSNLKNPPVVMSGLALGLLALGNYLESYHPLLRTLFGWLGFIIYMIVFLGMLRNPSRTKEELANPLTASVTTAFFMAGMILAGYLARLSLAGFSVLSLVVWWLSFIGILFHMLLFSRRYLLSFAMEHVFPSWTVLYVGIGVVPLTASVSHQYLLGQIIFWYGLLATFTVLPLVFYRTYKKGLPHANRPNICTICAPFSLILAGYTQTFPAGQKPLMWLVMVLLFLSQFFYWFLVVQIVKLLRRPFNPGFVAFTFPFVISATSLRFALQTLHWQSDILTTLSHVEAGLATLLVLYVLGHYLVFLLTKPI